MIGRSDHKRWDRVLPGMGERSSFGDGRFGFRLELLGFSGWRPRQRLLGQQALASAASLAAGFDHRLHERQPAWPCRTVSPGRMVRFDQATFQQGAAR